MGSKSFSVDQFNAWKTKLRDAQRKVDVAKSKAVELKEQLEEEGIHSISEAKERLVELKEQKVKLEEQLSELENQLEENMEELDECLGEI